MKKTEKYFSLVTDRIQELRLQLANPSISALEKEFVEEKIEYLRKLTDLPLLYNVINMPEEELQAIQEKYGYCDQDFLIQLYGLEKIASFMKHSRTVPLQYLKEDMLGDYDVMAKLLELKEKNKQHEMQKQKLWGIELDGSMSYLQLRHDEINLGNRERKVEGAIKDAVANYNLDTLHELRDYQNDSAKPLTVDFILKHKDKVEKMPGMKKVVASLTRTGFLGKLSKLSPFRKQNERKFIDAVIESYKNSNSLAALGIKKQDVTEMDEEQINSLIMQIKRQANGRRKKIAEAKTNIKAAKDVILKHVRNYEALQKQDKKEFLELLSTETRFLPKIFQNQIWDEPNLKNELKRVACFQEESILLDKLNKAHGEPILHIANNEENENVAVEEQPKVYTKKAA